MVSTNKVYQSRSVWCVTKSSHIIHHLVSHVLQDRGPNLCAAVHVRTTACTHPAAAKEVQQQWYLLKHIDALDSNKCIALEVKSFHDLHSLHDAVSLGI